jgi:hypothetical protein
MPLTDTFDNLLRYQFVGQFAGCPMTDGATMLLGWVTR